MSTDKPADVVCLRCERPVKTPLSRARRVGSGCWRILRADARARRVPVALPGLDRPAAATQAGPDLLEDVDPAGEDGPR
ncbi:hypothetical protein AB0873_14850 [Micromonospora sp. NPDC047707]|uniref:hypothetical protein n=1 Tax=Micromonospora sp. NPDC047707 TaxID=3154498 RepID=UPI0034521248